MTTDRSRGDTPRTTDQDSPSLSRRALLGGSAGAIAAMAGCSTGNAGVVVGKQDDSESTFDLADGTLEVDVEHGAVTVNEWSDDTVRVAVSKSGSLLSSLSSVTISARREGDAVIVDGSYDGAGFLRSGPDVDVRIDVPPGVLVDSLSVVNGDAVVADAGVRSGLSIETTNGDAVARDVDGDVSVETLNGDAIAESVRGFASARSKNGDAIIRDCDGADGAETTNGSVDADVASVRGAATFGSTNGTVEARLSPALDAAVVAATSRGDVTLSDAPLSADTVTATRVDGTIGDGTHDLRFSTTNGDVVLSELS